SLFESDLAGRRPALPAGDPDGFRRGAGSRLSPVTAPRLTLGALIGRLPARPDTGALVAGFVPPPRFAGESFDSYRPDPAFPPQAAARDRLREAAARLHRGAGPGPLARLLALAGRRSRSGTGLYLDGGFGVGKTH